MSNKLKGAQKPEEVKADRRVVLIKPNEYVFCQKNIYQITQVIDFDNVIGVDVKTNKAKILPISSLKAVSPKTVISNDYVHRDLSEIPKEKWEEMEYRLNSIKPLLDGRTRKEVVAHSKNIGVHYTTLYRWLKKYQTTGTITGILSNQRGSRKGAIRISQKQELVIQEIIDNNYLTKQKISPKKVIELIKIENKKRGIPQVGDTTVRNRIQKISAYNKIAKRESISEAQNKLGAAAGTFPNADFPLAVVQIDHTPVDVMIVDDVTRQSIGRPWLTLAIDIHTRMVVGYYLSLDAPSTTSVAMCIANSILPKDKLLLMNNIDAEWPVWGVMHTIHVDNGADFRATTLTQSCLNYDINIEFRPVGKSHFGGHIERLLGTFSRKIHALEGATFSDIKSRGTYDSEKNASMTFSGFERWFATLLVKVYHKSKHSVLDMIPGQKWREGIFGDGKNIGIGCQAKLSDPETVLIDFLPISKRTVQRNGININNLHYYDNVLRSWINAIDETTQKKRKFTVRQDPRDISYLWFYDPFLQMYYKIPLANQAIQSMNLWEYKKVKEYIKQRGLEDFNEDNLIDALDELNQMAEDAVKTTKKVRRQQQAKKNNVISQKLHQTSKVETPPESNNDDLWSEDINPFDIEGES